MGSDHGGMSQDSAYRMNSYPFMPGGGQMGSGGGAGFGGVGQFPPNAAFDVGGLQGMIPMAQGGQLGGQLSQMQMGHLLSILGQGQGQVRPCYSFLSFSFFLFLSFWLL